MSKQSWNTWVISLVTLGGGLLLANETLAADLTIAKDISITVSPLTVDPTSITTAPVVADSLQLAGVPPEDSAIAPANSIAPSEPEMPLSSVASMQQVTSVSQLSDVQPTDWAFQALQSLVERYGCIAGYPDGTYRGNRPLSRYEFAAGLNACMNRIEELIASSVDSLATKADLETVKKLQEEFAAELATLKGRVDALEARTSILEAQQFSTTTKLQGEVIFALTDAFSSAKNVDNQATFQNRVWLTLVSSFTGKDSLNVRLSSSSAPTFNLPNGATAEGRQTFQFDSGNSVLLGWLSYYTPITKKARLYAAAAYGIHSDYVTTTANPYIEDYGGGDGALSYYAQDNSIYNIGGGTGIGLNFNFSDAIGLDVGYLAGGIDSPASPLQGNGLFNGSYAALAQLSLQPLKGRLKVALTYVNSYHTGGTPIFSYGPDSPIGVSGTTLANFPGGLGAKVSANSYGLSLSYQFAPKIAVNVWGSYTDADIKGAGDNGEIWNYALALAFPDALKKGNLAGLIVGVEPYLGNAPSLQGSKNDLPLHIEGFYRFQVTSSISLTPGLIWLAAPNQNSSDSAFIGTIRTTFNF
jgi:hypothetical protein